MGPLHAAPLLSRLLGPLLAGAVGVAFVWVGCRRTQVPLRWFVAGGAIWLLGAIVLKGAVAYFTLRELKALQPLLSRGVFLAVSALHSGLLTGVFEVGTTLAAGMLFRALAESHARRVAVGIGAGAAEALFLGAIGLAMVSARFLLHPHSVAAVAPLTSVLLPGVERTITALAHAGARTLALASVATHRPALFAGGFAILFAVDAWANLAVQLRLSPWLIELGIVPMALVSAWVLARG